MSALPAYAELTSSTPAPVPPQQKYLNTGSAVSQKRTFHICLSSSVTLTLVLKIFKSKCKGTLRVAVGQLQYKNPNREICKI